MLGRIAKGWRTGFETGEEMLYALKLGSRFQWELAEADLLVLSLIIPSGPDKKETRDFVIL